VAPSRKDKEVLRSARTKASLGCGLHPCNAENKRLANRPRCVNLFITLRACGKANGQALLRLPFYRSLEHARFSLEIQKEFCLPALLVRECAEKRHSQLEWRNSEEYFKQSRIHFYPFALIASFASYPIALAQTLQRRAVLKYARGGGS
jgi:hypothetical protein